MFSLGNVVGSRFASDCRISFGACDGMSFVRGSPYCCISITKFNGGAKSEFFGSTRDSFFALFVFDGAFCGVSDFL